MYGNSLSSNLTVAWNQMGYCPQFDALFDNLTAKEHLQIYSVLRGISSEYVIDIYIYICMYIYT